MVFSRMLKHSLSLATTLVAVLGLALSIGCGGKEADTTLAKAVESPEASQQAILGYNRPHKFVSGVGLRAAARENQLVISVLNTSDSPIVIGPESFRILTNDRRQIPLDNGTFDLSFFPIRTIQPGEFDIFTVVIPNLKSLAGNRVVLNYPPKNVLLPVVIEDAEASTSITVQDPVVP